MEEFLHKGYRYTFHLSSRNFTAKFDKITYPHKTLIVTEYVDENGYVPGIRTMPFHWIRNIELREGDNEIETINLDTTIPNANQRKKSKRRTLVNNFTV